jgi:hypothetical protein
MHPEYDSDHSEPGYPWQECSFVVCTLFDDNLFTEDGTITAAADDTRAEMAGAFVK